VLNYKTFIKELQKVWRECERVLKPNGKLIINTPLMPMKKKEFTTHYNRHIFDLNSDILAVCSPNAKSFLLGIGISHICLVYSTHSFWDNLLFSFISLGNPFFGIPSFTYTVINDLNSDIQTSIIYRENTEMFLFDTYIWNRTNTSKSLMFGFKVVPLPANGSRTVSPTNEKSFTHLLTISSGIIAVCSPNAKSFLLGIGISHIYLILISGIELILQKV
jgi:hypothetical protein